MQTEQNEFKIGDFVKLNDWENFLEVTGLDESYPTARIRITEGDYGSWYDVSLGFIKQGDEMQESNEVTSVKQDEFRVGDVVWCVTSGKGKVEAILPDDLDFPLNVVYDSGGFNYYTLDGKYFKNGNRCLFFSEPKIEAATTRPFVSTLVGKRVVVKEYACYPQLFTVSWEDEKTFGDDIYSCVKANCKVYEVSSENLLKK